MNEHLKTFWTTKSDVKVLKGGRASGKTWDAAAMAIYLAVTYKVKFMCVRQFQQNIQDSVYSVLVTMIDRMGYQSEFEVLKSSIVSKTGSEFLFYGLARNTASIKGTEGVDVCWLEEAEGLTREQWEIIEPTIRKKGSECWILYNPRNVSDFVEQFHASEEDGILVQNINYNQNEHLSETMLRKINRMKTRDPERYEHIYLGKPLSDDDSVIIKRSWVEAAIDFHLQYSGEMLGKVVLGYDVADSGADKNAVTVCNGSVVTDCYEWQGGENELKKSADKVRIAAIKVDGHIVYDSIGVGAHTGGTLQASGFNSFSGFNAGGKVQRPLRKYNGVKQKEYFSNVKAQAWWLVADRLRNTHDYMVNGNTDYKPDDLISLSSNIPNIESLISELTTPRRDFDKAGRVKVESKDDLKKRDIISPNKADAFIMALSISLVNSNRVAELDYTGF